MFVSFVSLAIGTQSSAFTWELITRIALAIWMAEVKMQQITQKIQSGSGKSKKKIKNTGKIVVLHIVSTVFIYPLFKTKN